MSFASLATPRNVKWLLQQGVGWTILSAVLYWGGERVVLPLQTAHLQLVKDVAQAMNRQTVILQRIEGRLFHDGLAHDPGEEPGQ